MCFRGKNCARNNQSEKMCSGQGAAPCLGRKENPEMQKDGTDLAFRFIWKEHRASGPASQSGAAAG
jgi:hypothetical protein